jgi:hypothetical protein
VAAKRSDTAFPPRVAGTCLQAEAVERCSNLTIRKYARHFPDNFDRFHARTSSMLARAIPRHAQLRMAAAGPVDQKNRFTLLVIYIGDDLLD